MKSKWYCKDCQEYIDSNDVDDHEADGHEVKGMLRPDRLLSNDPWKVGADADDEEVTD